MRGLWIGLRAKRSVLLSRARALADLACGLRLEEVQCWGGESFSSSPFVGLCAFTKSALALRLSSRAASLNFLSQEKVDKHTRSSCSGVSEALKRRASATMRPLLLGDGVVASDDLLGGERLAESESLLSGPPSSSALSLSQVSTVEEIRGAAALPCGLPLLSSSQPPPKADLPFSPARRETVASGALTAHTQKAVSPLRGGGAVPSLAEIRARICGVAGLAGQCVRWRFVGEEALLRQLKRLASISSLRWCGLCRRFKSGGFSQVFSAKCRRGIPGPPTAGGRCGAECSSRSTLCLRGFFRGVASASLRLARRVASEASLCSSDASCHA